PGGAPRTVKYGSALTIGATPGKTSTTRKGSANAPGTRRVSCRGMWIDPSSSRPSPRTRTSTGSPAGAAAAAGSLGGGGEAPASSLLSGGAGAGGGGG